MFEDSSRDLNDNILIIRLHDEGWATKLYFQCGMMEQEYYHYGPAVDKIGLMSDRL